MIDYPFTEAEMESAAQEWGANCGPAALAFALQINLRDVRGAIPGFEERGYTSPTMMRDGLRNLGRRFETIPAEKSRMVSELFPSLVRIQWTGPWTKPGMNPKWAYRATHWIATWTAMTPKPVSMVFDCNGGCMQFPRWEREIVPAITGSIKRADGGWFPTHVWRVRK